MPRRSRISKAIAVGGLVVLVAANSPAAAQQAGQPPASDAPGPAGAPPGGPGPGPGPGPGAGPGASSPDAGTPAGMGPSSPGSDATTQGNASRPGGSGKGRSFGGLFGFEGDQGAGVAGRARTLDHDDALTARQSGKIMPLKEALQAANPDKAKVIEVKLLSDKDRTVYMIKLRHDDGSIERVTVNARTGRRESGF